MATFLLRLVAGLAGGIIGTLVLLLIFVLTSSFLAPLTAPGTESVSAAFVLILMLMIFIASTGGNILSNLFMALTERSKYTRIGSAVYRIFIISLIVFFLMIPIYLITSSMGIEITAYAVALHIIISAQVSALILEIVSNPKNALVGVYGITAGILVAAIVLFGLAKIVASTTILLFAALPVVWGSIAFVYGIVKILHGWFAGVYSADVADTQ